MSGSSSESASANKPQLSPSQMIDLYNQALPPTMATVMNQVPGSVNTLANAATLANPIFTAGTLDQLGEYSGAYQQAGAKLANQQAQSTANLISGAGGQAATNAVNLNNRLNPVQAASNAQAQNLLGAINMNGLSPGEQNAVERSLNQTNMGSGNLGLNNATNTVSNAMNFGGAFNSKLGTLGSALGAAGGVANNQNMQVNPTNVALGAGNTSGNFGLNQFNPSQANGLSNQITNAANVFGSTLGGVSSAGTGASNSNSGQGGLCCFIVMESYHGIMPSYVRTCRDHYYNSAPDIASGYKKMAKWLVPLMRRSETIRSLVWYIMVKPLTEYGSFVVRRTERKGRWARTFWFSIWKLMGKGN